MIKIIGDRGSGKTSELVKISSEKQIPILCNTNVYRRNLMEKAINLGVKIPAPLLLSDSLKDGCKQEEVLVEDISVWAEMLLNAVYGLNIVGYTESTNDLNDEVIKLGVD